jgi:hypothetical protein
VETCLFAKALLSSGFCIFVIPREVPSSGSTYHSIVTMKTILTYRVQLKVADKIWARVPHTKTSKNVRINLCPETFNLWVIAERLYDAAAAHFSRAVWEVLSNTCHARWIGRGGPTAWPPRSMSHLNPLDFCLWETPKHPCVCSSYSQRRETSPSHCGCLWDYSQLHRHLWRDVAVHDATCRGLHWISWRTFWALIINVLLKL